MEGAVKSESFGFADDRTFERHTRSIVAMEMHDSVTFFGRLLRNSSAKRKERKHIAAAYCTFRAICKVLADEEQREKIQNGT